MSALSIQPTYPIFTETDGQPLEDGYIWLGTANLDPQGNPINVYWDAALTQLAGQPIRTQGGYPVNSGTPARLYVNSDYSIRVMNKNGSVVYSAPTATERYSGVVITEVDASQVTFIAAGTGAIQRTAQDKMRDWVSVTDFGASPSATADVNTDAFNKACQAATTIYFPPGNYAINPRFMLYNDGTYSQVTRVGVSIPSGRTLLGYGVTLTSINTNSDNYSLLASFRTTGVNIKGFTLIGDRDSNTSNPTIPNDYGFGIDFRDVTNASVEDVISNKMWGDSFYLGVTDTAGTGSNRVTYRNIIGINSRRQGLSITGGEKIIVDGYRFEDISGAALGPCAGIDIEPNTTDLCNDIQLLNGYVEDSNRSIQVFKTINLIVNNLQVENCSILFPLLSDRVFDASISNVVARGGAASNYGILWQLSRTLVRVAVSNCQIRSVNLLPFYMEEDTTGAYQWTDVSINNSVFYVKDAPVSTSYVDVSTYGAVSFNNTVVLIPSGFDAADTVNLTGSDIVYCENTIWQNCTINNLGTATLTADVGVFGNRGNVFSGVGFNEDYASLLNGWTTVGGYQQQSIVKDSNGEIRIYGVLTGGTMLAGTVFMALPAGFRPALPQVCGITVDNAGVITAATVEVATNGNVSFQYTIPGNDEITLTSIRFLAGN